MNKLRTTKSFIFVSIFAFILILLFGTISASADSPLLFSTQETLKNKLETNPAIGSQADGTAILTSSGTRAPRVAQSDQYLALVYQQGTTIRLRSTKKEGSGAWIALQPVVGTGAAPSLVFSDNTTVHVVWVSSNNRQILYTSCTLAATSASCNNASTVQSGSQTLEIPDITIESNTLYVAWVNSGAGEAKVARKPVSGGSWQLNTTTLQANNASGGNVALAADAGNIHLAYIYNNQQSIRYYNSANGNTWSNQSDFGLANTYEKVSNPTIEAKGNNVYLAWDSLHNAVSGDDGLQKYALMGILSTNGGAEWKDSTTSTPSTEDPWYVTSNRTFDDNNSDDRRRTRNTDGANPAEEAGLRPSVALNHQDDFAIVWQERPDASCDEDEGGTINSNGTSELFLASVADPDTPDTSNWWTTVANVETASINFYSIDPDMVIDSSGDEHIVFMKSTADPGQSNCRAGGDLNPSTQHTYRIYYRGPYFTVVDPPTILLPVIIKN